MTGLSSRDAAPGHVRRIALVEELVQELEHYDDLSVREEAQRLADAQALLARILDDDPSLSQAESRGGAQ